MECAEIAFVGLTVPRGQLWSLRGTLSPFWRQPTSFSFIKIQSWFQNVTGWSDKFFNNFTNQFEGIRSQFEKLPDVSWKEKWSRIFVTWLINVSLIFFLIDITAVARCLHLEKYRNRSTTGAVWTVEWQVKI